MAGTEVSTTKLKEVANSLTEQIQGYNNAVNKIYDLGAELDAMWSGEASKKFKTNLGNDRDRFNKMSDLVKKYVDALNTDAQTYSNAESRVIEVINGNRK